MDAMGRHYNPGATVEAIDMGSLSALGVILAHQGGWDEFLMVAAPIIAFAFLLKAASRRANHLDDDEGAVFRSEQDTPSRGPRGLV